jgi:hypothetical protein
MGHGEMAKAQGGSMSLLELNPTTALMLVYSAPFWALLTFVLWKYGKDKDKWSSEFVVGFSVHSIWFIWAMILLWRS